LNHALAELTKALRFLQSALLALLLLRGRLALRNGSARFDARSLCASLRDSGSP